ncbi:hypothetical protein GGR58DRAFT_519379 [Xylaria digitata]|nr:hypothetical protein GGR58DRAFT_519379 [Xylaria digitata]
MKTAYCNKVCQTQHWEEHKSQCLGRRKVCRAVSLIYDLFVMFQNKAWIDKQITGITEKQVLFDSECQQLLCTCQGLVKLLLLPLCETLQEVEIMPRNAYRPTCDMRHDTAHNTMYNQHVVLCATLKSGEQMAVDIAGAQFGWRETVAQWGVWTGHRVAGKPLPQPFGYAQQCMQTLYPFAAPQFVQVSESQRSSLAQKMQAAVRNKMKEHKAAGYERNVGGSTCSIQRLQAVIRICVK